MDEEQRKAYDVVRLEAIRKGVPEHTAASLALYYVAGVEPGGFLTAVLSNDLSESLGRADEENRVHLFETVSFIYNRLAGLSWGSADKMKCWPMARKAWSTQEMVKYFSQEG